MRCLVPADASQLQAGWTLDATASEMLNVERNEWTVSAQHNYFASAGRASDRLLLGIWTNAGNSLIGLYIIKFWPADDIFSYSTLIGNKAWRGKNTADETATSICGHFFNELGYVKAKTSVRPTNKPVLWLLMNGVWKKEAKLQGQLLDRKTGERADVLVFGMLADDWRTYQRNRDAVALRKRHESQIA